MMAGAFALSLKEFAAKAKANADQLVGEVIVDVHAVIDKRSPVGDPSQWIYNRGTKSKPDYVNYLAYRDPPEGYVGGRFRANWQLGVGSIPAGTLNAVDPTGSATRDRITSQIPEEASGKMYYLVNNLPYAQRLEDGWSHQSAPGAMVSATTILFRDIVAKRAEALP